MQRLVQDTSLEAYHDIENLSEKRRKVFEAIKILGEACNLDIAYYLKWPINRVTPRTNELVKMQWVREAKRDITPKTGKRVIYWKVNDEVADETT